MIFHVYISSPRWPSGLRHPLFMQRVVGSIPAIADAISFTFLPQSVLKWAILSFELVIFYEGHKSVTMFIRTQ